MRVLLGAEKYVPAANQRRNDCRRAAELLSMPASAFLRETIARPCL